MSNSYTPTTWSTGDTIGADALNNAETGIAGAHDRLDDATSTQATLVSQVDGLPTKSYVDTSVQGVTTSVQGVSTRVSALEGRTFAPVATTGSYNDLTNRPALAPVATTGSYNDLTNRPTAYTDAAALAAVAAAASVAPTGAWNFSQIPKVNGTPLGSGGGAGGGANAQDKIIYVSKAGSDTNDGLGWKTAKLTVAAGLAALNDQPGTVYVGAGTYQEGTLVPPQGAVIRGTSMSSTAITLTTSGTLISIANRSNVAVEDVTLTFASTAITGTLAVLDNAFTARFSRVSFEGLGTLGQGVSGQQGVQFINNAGDSWFTGCTIANLYTGVMVKTVVNFFQDCLFYGNRTAVTCGPETAPTNGLVISNSTFNEVGDFYINLNGSGQAWVVDRCWFDGYATTAIAVGNASNGNGPTLFSLTNCAGVAGATTSLLINASETTLIDAVQFINTGSNPVDLSIPAPVNCPYGRLGQINSYQRTSEALRALVPAQWDGSGRLANGTISGSYTLGAGDVGNKVVHCTASSAMTLTAPSDATAAIPVGSSFPWRQYGAGQITFAAGSGATLLSRGSVFKSAGQYAEGLLTKTAANTWLLSGDIA